MNRRNNPQFQSCPPGTSECSITCTTHVTRPSPPRVVFANTQIRREDHRRAPSSEMRPLTRLLLRRSIRPTPLRVSPVQIACFHATPTSRYASEKSGLTQRLRQKIWGGNAPGPEDPYTTAEETKQVEEVDMAGYVAAEDGRGLPIIGLPEKLGEWALDTYVTMRAVEEGRDVGRIIRDGWLTIFQLLSIGKGGGHRSPPPRAPPGRCRDCCFASERP